MDRFAAVRPVGAHDVEITLMLRSKLAFPSSKPPYVGIFGAGLSGQGAATLCRVLGWFYEILDEKMQQTPRFGAYDLCMFSPGFPPSHPWWQAAKASGALCINELDLAASCCDNPIIAVTGTNGKTSTVQLLSSLLQANGTPAMGVGNNGVVLSKIVAEQAFPATGTFVCEISSYQAWSLRFLHPQCTLWTNMAPDHLLYHGNWEAYVQAKKHLLMLTRGKIICGPRLKPLLKSVPNVIFAPEGGAEEARYPAGFSFGQRENFSLIRTFANTFSISSDKVQSVLRSFQQPAHRLYCCRKIDDVEFWNDSKATNLHAVQAALESLKHRPQLHWVLGGQDKGEALDTFIDAFNCYPNVTTIYTIGTMGSILAQQAHHFRAKIQDCGTLDRVFATFAGSNIPLIFSPGFTSWDQYTSFEKRGEHFERLAEAYKG